jgi:hypothetical protein
MLTNWVSHVDEGVALPLAPQRKIEDAPVPLQRLIDVADLDRDMIDADEPRFVCSGHDRPPMPVSFWRQGRTGLGRRDWTERRLHRRCRLDLLGPTPALQPGDKPFTPFCNSHKILGVSLKESEMPRPGVPSLDQLAVFLAVVETGSFAAAGRRLGRATSAVSYAIANLEQQLGVQLFDRDQARRPAFDGGRCRRAVGSSFSLGRRRQTCGPRSKDCSMDWRPR